MCVCQGEHFGGGITVRKSINLIIPVTEFRILWQWNLDSELQSLVRFRIPCAVFLIPKPKTLDSTRNISRIPESGSPALHGAKGLMS